MPATRILTEAARRHGARVAFSASGVLLEQLKTLEPETFRSLQALAAAGAEVLCETACHSLSSLINEGEFRGQVDAQRRLLKSAFGVEPGVFRNTELIVSDAITPVVAGMGFKAMLVEGASQVLGWRSPNHVYASESAPSLRLLPRNYQLSDDIAFRFSARDWSGWPLTADKYAEWVRASGGDVANIFMDFETFGEHQHEGSGIMDFLRALPSALQRAGVRMVTPSDLAARRPIATLSYPRPTSWADTERDVSAWLGNRLQLAAHERLYALRDAVFATGSESLIDDWSYLSTSDHFYYMSTKWHADGDVHTYFSPYATPYDAYISFMNVMRDMEQRVGAVGDRPSAGDRKLESAQTNGRPKTRLQKSVPAASAKDKRNKRASVKLKARPPKRKK